MKFLFFLILLNLLLFHTTNKASKITSSCLKSIFCNLREIIGNSLLSPCTQELLNERIDSPILTFWIVTI